MFNTIRDTTHDWTLDLQAHRNTDVIYIDFKKAFDSVSHSKLLIKLPAYDLPGKLLTWLAEFLHNRSQIVKLNSCYSHRVHVISGVPQGSVLGLTLFLLFINDVADLFVDINISCKLYADDIKQYSCINTTLSQDHLNYAINKLYEWSNVWQLQITVDMFCL